MIKRFLDGLAFGAGFGIAFSIVSIAVWMFLIPTLLSQGSYQTPGPIVFDGDESPGIPMSSIAEFEDFSEMSVDDQIAAASVIALIDYEPADDGRMQAIIGEILKKSDDVEFSYEIGDEYHSHSYYPDGRRSNDGAVIFFAGSPARMRYSTTYSGDRITGLSNMTEDMFRQKCEDAE